MIDWLIELDRHIFLFLNQTFTHPFLDHWMPVMRFRDTWFPLYAVILLFVIIQKKKSAVIWILGIALAVGLADIISSHFFKPAFGRYRPCHELSAVFKDMVLRLPNCPGHGSFTSSHAANHFSIAGFIFLTTSSRYRWLSGLFFLWAAVICWAQIYVGVHYPLDILGGAIIGSGTAFLSFKIYRYYSKKIFLKNGTRKKDTTATSG